MEVNINVQYFDADSFLDKSYSSRDRRHLTELNQEKTTSNYLTSITREVGGMRLGSLERENSKLVSPEKVLSLRRNSSDVNHQTSQPLSSLLDSEELSRSAVPKNELASKRYVNEAMHEERTNHLLNSKQSFSTTSNHVTSSSTKRASIIDNASNVKGMNQYTNKWSVFFITLSCYFVSLVSSMGATPYRRDSWDAMTKTGIAIDEDVTRTSSSKS